MRIKDLGKLAGFIRTVSTGI